ncbi:adenine phosphoribosyltransferase [Verrucomicrobiota bacterium]|jgi:adenine phosphoribosyltransferase|nr:adenine phosphoribosyltransferase [Verrucomicrobiota bacterium]
MDLTAQLRSSIRDVPDFPKPGIVFKDITPVLADGRLFRSVTDRFAEELKGLGVTKIVGIDARGFIFAGAVASQLGLGFIPIRKKGKLPWTTRSASYQLEYGESVVEIHVDAVKKGEKVALIDDVLATGGTAAAAIKLLEECGAVVVRAEFLMELGFLAGREKLGGTPVVSLVIY